jgi:hypothetical protein
MSIYRRYRQKCKEVLHKMKMEHYGRRQFERGEVIIKAQKELQMAE